MTATEQNLASLGLSNNPKREAEPTGSPPGQPSAPSHTAERRQLTLMFCDLVDYVGLSTRLDPEELSDVIGAYRSACLRPVKHYDGHVARYLGDGILIFFGYPIAHEDDAERAVRASLELIESVAKLNDTLDVDLKVRVGIATGLVVVGDVSAEGVTETDAVTGEAVNLAARLQGLASPNSVVVSSLTRQLAAERFEYLDLGIRTIQGFDRPIPLHQVVGERDVSRFEASATRGLTPFVGREEDLYLLTQSWELAVRGQGQVVWMSGEAGIGKSRLVQEFRRRLEVQRHFEKWENLPQKVRDVMLPRPQEHAAENIGIVQLQCSPYYQNSVLQPVIERLEADLLIKGVQSPGSKIETLRVKLTELGLASGNHLVCLALLFEIPLEGQSRSLAFEPDKMRRLTFETLLAMFGREARGQPMLIVVEDLQWCDPSTLEFLGLLIERLRRSRAMMIATFRSDFSPPWRAGSHVAFLPLSKLTSKNSKDLVGKLAGDTLIPETVLKEILDRCDGVPLFVEELARSVIDATALQSEQDQPDASRHPRQFAIPSSLQDSLIARLDQLPSGKGLAQLAALLGRSFGYELLAALSTGEAVLQRALSDLIAAGLFIERGTPPQAIYEFRHVLVRDAAYQMLLKRKRQEYHARIAEVMERQFPERIQSEPEILAHHWNEARQAAKSIRYWLLAGKRASQRSGIREAVSHLQKGLALVDKIPDEDERKRIELEIWILLAAALMATAGPGAQEVKAAYVRALSLCEELPRSPLHFAAFWGAWRIAMDFRTGRERADRLLELARGIGDAELELQAHHCQWATLFMLGEQEACCNQIEKGLELYDAETHFPHAGVYGGHDAKVCALGEAGLSFYLRGYPERALKYGDGALRWARQLDHSGSIAHALDYAVVLSRYRRDANAVLRHAEDMIRYAEQQGLRDHGVKGRFFRGYALAQFGQVEWGLNEMRECMEIELRIGSQEDFPVYFEMLAEIAALAGMFEDSLHSIGQAAPVVEKKGIRYWSAELHRRRGEVLLARADKSGTEAEDEFRQALAISREQNAKLLELRALYSLVRLNGKSGGRDSHYQALHALASDFPEQLETPDLADAKTLLSRI
jgi:class 3 adenylate cyclase/predicted ATPase